MNFRLRKIAVALGEIAVEAEGADGSDAWIWLMKAAKKASQDCEALAHGILTRDLATAKQMLKTAPKPGSVLIHESGSCRLLVPSKK